ncbi:hypothetical protein BDV95DRAFT_612381 [Massariosphaeria phaeospora]|uniref:Uncharacterized protein n=1 Tax=Massariosphaeria phaeospora TaxID=100035 RepID=A0A7C8I6P7_9PLEO|nr:hypothetical protein BDV95DRAFT_612381 [Massariosphaeria phaeospora]
MIEDTATWVPKPSRHHRETREAALAAFKAKCQRNSHSHPYPRPEKVNQRSVLVQLQPADLDITVEVRGLAGASRRKATDVYCPEVRRSPFSTIHHVNHLDVVSCWKGLSLRQACEVVVWERLFERALEAQLWGFVRAGVLSHLYESSQPIDKSLIIVQLTKDFSDAGPLDIGVNVLRLIQDMVRGYYDDVDTDVSSNFNWFTSSQDLHTTVYNFLRTRDCFFAHLKGTHVRVAFGFERMGESLILSADVDWHPPSTSFANLQAKLPSGAEYRIYPTCIDSGLDSEQGSNKALLAEFTTNTEYRVTSSQWLPLWNPNLRCFRGVVSDSESHEVHRRGQVNLLSGQRLESNIVETSFCAIMVRPFPGNVRFERTTRYLIKLDLESEPTGLGGRSAAAYVSPHTATADDLLPKSTPVLRPEAAPWVPSYSNTPLRGSTLDVASASVEANPVKDPYTTPGVDSTLNAVEPVEVRDFFSEPSSKGSSELDRLQKRIDCFDSLHEYYFPANPSPIHANSSDDRRRWEGIKVLQSISDDLKSYRKRKISEQVPGAAATDTTCDTLDKGDPLRPKLVPKRQKVNGDPGSSSNCSCRRDSVVTESSDTPMGSSWCHEADTHGPAVDPEVHDTNLEQAVGCRNPYPTPSDTSSSASSEDSPVETKNPSPKRDIARGPDHLEEAKTLWWPRRHSSGAHSDEPVELIDWSQPGPAAKPHPAAMQAMTITHHRALSTPLNQDEIRYNYEVFLQAKERELGLDGARDADVDEEESREFEKVFLEDEGAEEGASEEVSMVMTEGLGGEGVDGEGDGDAEEGLEDSFSNLSLEAHVEAHEKLGLR